MKASAARTRPLKSLAFRHIKDFFRLLHSCMRAMFGRNSLIRMYKGRKRTQKGLRGSDMLLRVRIDTVTPSRVERLELPGDMSIMLLTYKHMY